MIAFRRLLIIASICGAAGFLGMPSNAQTLPSPSQVQVHLLRGLGDIFSRGMDTLTVKLNQRGYNARVYSTNAWQAIARQIADGRLRGQTDIVVLIGHSLGADATIKIANQLDKANIPIELIVTFDGTEAHQVPKNVLHLVNFYQNNGFGKRIGPGPGFRGELTNLDLTADASIRHINIDKSDRLHAYVIQKIVEIVNKDLANKVLANKPKPKKSQNRQ